MRYVHVEKPGGPEVLELRETPPPSPGPGEVLIEVHAAGVNRPDIFQRAGSYPPPPGASPLLGLEVAGRIAALGPGVSQWKKGDEICALAPGGGYAELCVVPASSCLPIPRGLSPEQAAGIPETYFTVYSNVVTRGGLKRGERFLVHGGTSGIGTTAIQLARELGAETYATAGSDEKCRACEKLGTKAAINYKERDFVAELRKLTSDQGVDLILDMVGGDYFQRNLDCLAFEGRLVQISAQQGREVKLSLRKLMMKRLYVTGSTLRPQSALAKARIADGLRRDVWPWLESGRMQPIIDRVFPLSQVADAHRYLESGRHVGKVILRI